jgi:hypothetical protein
MSISSIAFYLLLVIGLACALIGGYYLALLTITISQAYTLQLETDFVLLILGVVLIGIALWMRKK